ncbi:vWA domain-containing protein [Litoreibacter roseus]|uniref:VWFA domain-containing protein n=1 Tax=Litoreibacter roseus TaxID=2601869 RepID=A0A6N6JII8_9RHOB|nr:VWA domain-containing protein [Litoreibacter roseus]GFE65229.1 hypothetical protein KIN_23030 [Litoreibacter roseus]
MTDELDKLRAALGTPPPASDAARDAALRVAEKNFESLQGSAPGARPTDTGPERSNILKGLRDMFATRNLKPLLLTTSSLVVLGVGFVFVQNQPGPQTTVLAPQVEPAAPEMITAKEAQPSADQDVLQDAPLASPLEAPMILEEIVEEFAPAEVSRPGRRVVNPSASTSMLQGSQEIRILPVPDPYPEIIEDRDRFANETPNAVKITSEEPVSTFSIDVDTASYAWVRRALQNGQLPNAEAVRIEEMINYFPYDYAAPTGDLPFQQSVTVTDTPWNDGTQLVHIGIQGELPAIEDRPPLNLVLLIDTSGSMSSPDKLPLLIQSFRLMLPELRPEDQVAIVTYAGSAGTVLEPTAASETGKIEAALNSLISGGSTAGAAGLTQAYALAEQMADEGEISRVLLATDGDFNVGLSSDEALKTFIEEKRDDGTFLSVLGFGRGNLNDALMQTLAQNGNGQAAYIDTLSEARKVLVDQLAGALYPIASDVKIQVEFNPAEIAEYRLIGYETRALKREDFNNDKVDAGEIGAGHTVTAIYEITPIGSDAILNDALRYGADDPVASDSDELGFLRLRYKTPGESESQLIETPISTGVSDANTDVRFATAIAGFGQLLQGSSYTGDWTYEDAIALANTAKGDDTFGYRTEAVTLMRLAESLSKAR